MLDMIHFEDSIIILLSRSNFYSKFISGIMRTETEMERDFVIGIINFLAFNSELSTISGSIISSPKNKQLSKV